MLHFGTDGVRGVAIDELTPDSVRDLGRAIGRVLAPGAVVVGRDTRQSGPILESALVQGLTAEGVHVHLLGVAPTPAIAFIAERHSWVGVSITASHNPWRDNGIKVFGAGGTKLSDVEQIAIEREWHAMSTAEAAVPEASVSDSRELLQEYVDHRVSIVGEGRLAGMAVVLDCANGAMSDVAPAVLRAAGVDVTVIHATPDGTNINDGCGATSMDSLTREVSSHVQVDAGIAFDGDGDRVLAVSESGEFVDGDHLLALAALDLAERGMLRNRGVAVTVMTNVGFHRAMDGAGINVVVTPVGDRSVLAAMEEHDLVLGGEQSGHIIHHAHATTGDGLLAALLLIEQLFRVRQPLSVCANSAMTSYPQVLVNVRTTNKVDHPAEEFADLISRAERTIGSGGRVLVRASGTEPLVRVMVEAGTPETARASALELANAIAEFCGGSVEESH